MTSLAGEVADGSSTTRSRRPPGCAERLLPALDARRRAAPGGRPEVAGALICAPRDDDPGAARRAAAATVGFYATVRTYAGMFSEHGFGGRLGAIRRAFLAGDGRGWRGGRRGHGGRVRGGRDASPQVRERARAYEGLADRLWATPPHHGQGPRSRPAGRRGSWRRSTPKGDLAEYRGKRDFGATPEPAPTPRAGPRATPRFVVQRHDARPPLRPAPRGRRRARLVGGAEGAAAARGPSGWPCAPRTTRSSTSTSRR